MKKPALADANTRGFLESVKLTLQIITGRRNNKITIADITSTDAATDPPTQAEFDALRADVLVTRQALLALIARFDD